jgi:N-acetylmuramoyl-L-alanine amidase
MLRKYGAHNRGVKYARYAVLRRGNNPSVLVECGFVSNYAERKRCMKGWYRQKMAEGIVDGIVKYQSARSRGYVK